MKSQTKAPVTTYEAILGQVLRINREKQKVGQAEMARRVGVTQPYWSKLESGRANPSVNVLRKAGQALRISHADLLKEADSACQEAKLRGVQIINEDEAHEFDWLPLLGAAAIGALVALVLAKNK